MANRTLLVVGDNLGLRDDQIDYPDVRILKFPVTVGEKEYRDGSETNAAWLVEKFRSEKAIAKSAAITRGDLTDIVEKEKSRYDRIVHVVMSSVLSQASYAVAEEVREAYRDQVEILNIDTRQVTTGVGCALLRVLPILADSKTSQEIAEKCRLVAKNTFSAFIIPDLSYLQRGGRIGKARALIGSVLRIIPIVGLLGDDDAGMMVPLGKGRTFDQVNDAVIEFARSKLEQHGASKLRAALVADTGADTGAVEGLKKRLGSIPCDQVVYGTPRLVEAVHLGPGAYAFSFSLV